MQGPDFSGNQYKCKRIDCLNRISKTNIFWMKVVIYEPILEHEQVALNQLVSWDHNYIVLDVGSTSDFIVVCEEVRSNSALVSSNRLGH